jgi:hypothetical protein
MEIGDFNGPTFDESEVTSQVEEALRRMMTSASDLELKQAFDEYLAILDRSGLADLWMGEVRNSKKGGIAFAGGAD